jgi:hypothetical protein
MRAATEAVREAELGTDSLLDVVVVRRAAFVRFAA